jgi:hypothetical protein
LPAAEPASSPPLGPTPQAVTIPLGVVEAALAPSPRITGDLLISRAALAEVEQRAQALYEAGQPLQASVLEPLSGAPLDGARPADLLQALAAAFSARSIAPRTP